MARKIVVALTGGIAAYKTAELVSRLKKADCEVRVVMTKNACEFITPLTMETLSGYPCAGGAERTFGVYLVGFLCAEERCLY